MATFATNVNYNRKLLPMIQEISVAVSPIWGVLDHSSTDFKGNNTIEYVYQGTAPVFNARQSGTADGGRTPDGRYTEQNIINGDGSSANEYYDLHNISEHRSFVPMEKVTKTIGREREWSGAFPEMNGEFSGLNNEIVAFTARQTSQEILPEYDTFAHAILNAYTPASNKIAVDATTGNIYKAFAELTDRISEAEYTRLDGTNRPLDGSGKRIGLVTRSFWTRFIQDLNGSQSVAYTESQYKNQINGVIGNILQWDLIDVKPWYMPYAVEPTYNNEGQMEDEGVRFCFIGFDPEYVVAPLIVDKIYKDTSRINSVTSDFVNGHHFYDCFVKVRDNKPANWKDYNSLFGGIYFARNADDKSKAIKTAETLDGWSVDEKRGYATVLTDAILKDAVDTNSRHSHRIPSVLNYGQRD